MQVQNKEGIQTLEGYLGQRRHPIIHPDPEQRPGDVTGGAVQQCTEQVLKEK